MTTIQLWLGKDGDRSQFRRTHLFINIVNKIVRHRFSEVTVSTTLKRRSGIDRILPYCGTVEWETRPFYPILASHMVHLLRCRWSAAGLWAWTWNTVATLTRDKDAAWQLSRGQVRRSMPFMTCQSPIICGTLWSSLDTQSWRRMYVLLLLWFGSPSMEAVFQGGGRGEMAVRWFAAALQHSRCSPKPPLCSYGDYNSVFARTYSFK